MATYKLRIMTQIKTVSPIKLNVNEFGNSNMDATIWQYMPNMKYWALIRTFSLWYASCLVTDKNVMSITVNPKLRCGWGQINSKNYAIFPKGFNPNETNFTPKKKYTA